MLTMAARARLLVVLLVAVAAGAAAYFASRAWLVREAPAILPAAKAPATAPAIIPEHRPEVTLADRDGRPRSLSEWDGRPQMSRAIRARFAAGPANR
jgi:hypothetical protein